MKTTTASAERYSLGIAADYGPPYVHTFATLRFARMRAAEVIREGGRVLWITNINTGREHKLA